MAEIVVTHPNGNAERFPLSRLKTTIGRSARSDICIPDAFASRLHAEIRQEGGSFFLSDLGSANGTRYNGSLVSDSLPIQSGGEIQIGETRIRFEDASLEQKSVSATLIADATNALDPSKTISLSFKKNPTADIMDSSMSSRTDLMGLISKVGVALLSSSGLDETLNQVSRERAVRRSDMRRRVDIVNRRCEVILAFAHSMFMQGVASGMHRLLLR